MKKTIIFALSSFLAIGAVNVPSHALAATTNASKINSGFTDVSDTFWAHDEIMDLHNEGIIMDQNERFYPNEEVTREDTAIWLANALKLEMYVEVHDPNFKDIPRSHPSYRYIASVAKAGIFKGNDDGLFAPNEPLTRAQMAKVLVESFKLTGEYTKGFTDIRDTFWAKEYINQLASSGVTTGYEEDNTFRPNNPTTRAQLVTFLHRALKQKESKLVQEEPDYVRNLSSEEIRERFGHYTADDFQHVFGNVEIVRAQFSNNKYYEIIRSNYVDWDRYAERVQDESKMIIRTPIEELERSKRYYEGSIMNNTNYPYRIYLSFDGVPVLNHPYYDEFNDKLRSQGFWAIPNYDPINQNHASFAEVLTVPKQDNQTLVNFHRGYPYQFKFEKNNTEIFGSEPLINNEVVYVELETLLYSFSNVITNGVDTVESNGKTMVNLRQFAQVNNLFVREMSPIGQYQLANYELGQSF